MSEVPQTIRARKDESVFEIIWNDERTSKYPFYFLRCQCPCAACVNEFTGERMLDPATVPRDIEPAEVAFSGNYALKIKWTDGHFTGLYSWDYLDRLDAVLKSPSQHGSGVE